MSPTCLCENTMPIARHEFLWECSQQHVKINGHALIQVGSISNAKNQHGYPVWFSCNSLLHQKYISESVINIFPKCVYKVFMLWWSFMVIAIIRLEIWIIVQSVSRQTDGKRCIWAHRAIRTGGLENANWRWCEPTCQWVWLLQACCIYSLVAKSLVQKDRQTDSVL